MQSTKSIILIIILLALILGLVGFFFRSDLLIFLGVNNKTIVKKDFRGENLTYNSGGKVITIPPKFSENSLDYLKKQMTEKAGLPIRVERKGNPLPFGIP